jgi:5'-deoxynucleotidase YfbR-like HD superfamily hydrolase
MMDNQDAWISTYSNAKFYLLNPTKDMICIEDIAHALSHVCRFGGHVSRFYSVAQHSIFVSERCSPEIQLEGLMHDSTEAYYGDMVRPLKYLMPNYQELENKLHHLINRKFKLKYNKKVRDEIKKWDNIALVTEKRDFKHGALWDNYNDIIPDENRIKALSPKQAEKLFLKRFEELSKQRS